MFPFVPRKVAQKSKPPRARVDSVTSLDAATASNVAPTQPPAVHSSTSDTKGKGKRVEPAVSDEDLIALLCLSFSDHSLWANVELRRALASADEGWLPLSTLQQHSSYFAHLSPRPPESAYVKAIRNHAAEIFEVRMRVTAPSRAAWSGANVSHESESGGYEIRRKDWRDALLSARNTTRQDWEKSTVYVECLPLPHRTIPRIYHFASALIGLSGSQATPSKGVQAVSLPAHHLDHPGDVPKAKGFALVTFASEEYATRLVEMWPWLPRRTDVAEDEETDAPAREAVKFGFRTLPKARWDELKEEYLAYRQRLLDQVAQAEPEPEPVHPGHRANGGVRQDQGDNIEHAAPAPQVPARELTSVDSPFPPGCLVYVRGVHPETNRTTLKALFAARGFGPDALDYVDYSKGMGTCHLRLSAPHHAQALVAAFRSRPVVQRQGLDSTGAEGEPEGDGAKAISIEVVEGEREELYWSKVPEKIRREAVRKALAQSSETGGEPGDGLQDAGQEEEAGGQEGKRKRKRRRKA